jgi:hypothetical protein
VTFLQIKQRIARRTNKIGASDTLDTLTDTRLGEFINETHKAILRRPGMESLRHGIVTIASVASQQAYALPTEGVARINRIWETTNDRKLVMKTLAWLREQDPDPQQGTPWAWVPTGYAEVQAQPADASQVFVKSTSASDIGLAYVEVIVSTGHTRTLSVTMTGTTAVTLSASVSNIVQVTKFYLAAAAVGTVTLHEDSGVGTELARISIGKRRAQHYAFLLHDIPSSVITYTCDILRGIPEMSVPTDEPLLPEDFHDLLIDGALLKELTKADDPQRWRAVNESFTDGLNALQSFVTNHPDHVLTWGSHLPQRSRLGAYYPAGS